MLAQTTDNMPLFRARRDCILMHLSHIRALVFYNKVLVFDPDKRFVCEFVADLARDMAEGAHDDSNAPGTGTADDVRRALAAEMHEFQVHSNGTAHSYCQPVACLQAATHVFCFAWGAPSR